MEILALAVTLLLLACLLFLDTKLKTRIATWLGILTAALFFLSLLPHARAGVLYVLYLTYVN